MPLGMRPSLLAFEEFNPAFGVSGRRRNFIPLRAGGNVDLESILGSSPAGPILTDMSI